MNIEIKTIPHKQQRYETVGDWWFDGADNLQIRVSAMGDERYESLVAFHELAEALLCKERGISEADVTAFDKKHEGARQATPDTFHIRRDHGFKGYDEPGAEPTSPYRREHFFATTVERLMAAELGVDWAEYDETVAEL